MPTNRRVIRRGRRCAIEEVTLPGTTERAWFIRCADHMLSKDFVSLPAAEAWFREVEAGTAEPSP